GEEVGPAVAVGVEGDGQAAPAARVGDPELLGTVRECAVRVLDPQLLVRLARALTGAEGDVDVRAPIAVELGGGTPVPIPERERPAVRLDELSVRKALEQLPGRLVVVREEEVHDSVAVVIENAILAVCLRGAGDAGLRGHVARGQPRIAAP